MLLPSDLPGPAREGLATRAGVPRSRRMLRKPGGPGPGSAAGRDRAVLPEAAEISGQRPGGQQLGPGGHDDPCPAVGVLWGADFGRGEAEGALDELEDMLIMRKSARAPRRPRRGSLLPRASGWPRCGRAGAPRAGNARTVACRVDDAGHSPGRQSPPRGVAAQEHHRAAGFQPPGAEVAGDRLADVTGSGSVSSRPLFPRTASSPRRQSMSSSSSPRPRPRAARGRLAGPGSRNLAVPAGAPGRSSRAAGQSHRPGCPSAAGSSASRPPARRRRARTG